MCDISKHTKLKTVTIYKIVYTTNNKYYSIIGAIYSKKNKLIEIKLGKVSKQNKPLYIKKDPFYNQNMIGKISGFGNKSITKKLYNHLLNSIMPIKLLKIKLGGTIMSGTGEGMAPYLQLHKFKTYAGSIVLSIEEVKQS